MSKDRRWEVKALSKTLAAKKDIIAEKKVDYLHLRHKSRCTILFN